MARDRSNCWQSRPGMAVHQGRCSSTQEPTLDCRFCCGVIDLDAVLSSEDLRVYCTYLRDLKNNVAMDPGHVNWSMPGQIGNIGNRKALERPWVRGAVVWGGAAKCLCPWPCLCVGVEAAQTVQMV